MEGAQREGIVLDEKTGEYFLPQTQRPDGTWRKARRVKDGYVPQEEVPVYENKGVQWMKSRSNLPPGLDPRLVEEASNKKPEAAAPALSKAAKRNKQRKEKKKKEAEAASVQKVSEALANSKLSEEPKKKSTEAAKSSKQEQQQQPKAEPEKRLKNLKKKLRQIDELKSKIDSGELKEATKEQLEKIGRRQTIEDEIKALEKE